MQPQLFVTQDFKTLTEILENYVDTMALRTGGLAGVQKAINSGDTACIVYSSGLQLSGTFATVSSSNGDIEYIQTAGPTSLSYKDTELADHGKNNHKNGFGSPVGKIKNISKYFHLLSDDELVHSGFNLDELCEFEFESGVKVKGVLKNIIRKDAKIILMSFTDCVVTHDNHILFFPEWGEYDMAIGEEITSVFNGPADHESYGHTFEAPSEKTHKIEHTYEARNLHNMYQKIRDYRIDGSQSKELIEYWEVIKKDFSNEWLLILEIFELAEQNKRIFQNISTETEQYLLHISKKNNDLKMLISDGLEIIKKAKRVS